MSEDSKLSPDNPQEEIDALIRQLHQTEERLRELTQDKVDSVMHPSGASYLLHRAQGELLKSEAAQREFSTLQLAILDALPAHIALLNEQGVVVAVNDAWKGFGSNNVFDTPEYGLGRNYIQICESAHGDCAEEARKVGEGIRAVLRGEVRSFTLEYPCHSPQEKQWFRVMVTPLHKGGAGGAVIMHVNVSERKLAEAALLKSEAEQLVLVRQLELERARLVAAQQVAKVGSWETDLETLAVIWSAETYRIFEKDPSSFQPTHEKFLETLHPEDRTMVDEAFVSSLEKSEACVIEHRLLLPEGRIKHLEERWQVFRDEQGKPVRALGTCQDITERKLAEGEIERQASFAAFNPNPVLELSAEGEVSYANAAAGNMARALKCEQIQQLLPPETAEIVRECLASGKPRLRLELEQFGRVISWSFYPIPGRSVVHCYAGDITDRKSATREAERVATLLKAVADGTPDAVYVKDLAGRYLLFNEAAARFVGRRKEEVIGRDDTSIFSAEDARLVMAADRYVIESNEVHTSEETLTAAGVTRVYQATKAPYRDSNGKVIGVIGISHDITEAKMAEKRAADEHRYNETLIATSPLAIITYRASGQAVTANAASVKMLGARDMEAVLGQNFREIEFWQKTGLLAAAEEALASGQLVEREVQGRNSFGKELWMHGQFKPFTCGDEAYLLCFFDDIRERKWAEERLAEQAALLDAAHEAIFVKDLDDQIIYWNKGAERLYGWKAEEALGQKSEELLYQDPGPLHEAYQALMSKGEWQGEMVKLTKDGRKLNVDVRWTLVRDAQGKPRSILAINVDITEKKRIEAQFLRAQRMESIGTLAGGIAHDLNNVLAPILMSVEVLREVVADEEALGILDTVQSSAQRGAELVKQVLAFARGVEGQQVEMNLTHQLRDIQKVIRETFPKNIRPVFQLGNETWPVTGDPTQLHQVMMNLVVNARDAMPEGGTLEVTTENVVLDEVYVGMNPDAKPGAFVVISVIDNGMGIPAEVKDRIFEPFFTTKEVGKGTGLGLSTVSAIVRSHGGFIHVYSEVGKGSKFKVYLPAKTTNLATEEVAIKQTQLPTGQGEWVLVVDDEENIRAVTKKMLERYGYRVHLAAHGAEAVGIYARYQAEVAVVLTDMAMPVMDGPATIIALKSINPEVKIIGTSGHASNGGVAKALGAGVQHFIPKPYTAERVLTMLAEVLRGELKNGREQGGLGG